MASSSYIQESLDFADEMQEKMNANKIPNTLTYVDYVRLKELYDSLYGDIGIFDECSDKLKIT